MSKRVEKRLHVPAPPARVATAPRAKAARAPVAPAAPAAPSLAAPARPPAAAPPPSRPASKISITVDAGVLQEVRKLIRGTGLSLSAHITEALERDLRRRRLQQLIEDHEAERGVIGEEELSEIQAQWQG